jgi:hypothetical protein
MKGVKIGEKKFEIETLHELICANPIEKVIDCEICQQILKELRESIEEEMRKENWDV